MPSILHPMILKTPHTERSLTIPNQFNRLGNVDQMEAVNSGALRVNGRCPKGLDGFTRTHLLLAITPL